MYPLHNKNIVIPQLAVLRTIYQLTDHNTNSHIHLYEAQLSSNLVTTVTTGNNIPQCSCKQFVFSHIRKFLCLTLNNNLTSTTITRGIFASLHFKITVNKIDLFTEAEIKISEI